MFSLRSMLCVHGAGGGGVRRSAKLGQRSFCVSTPAPTQAHTAKPRRGFFNRFLYGTKGRQPKTPPKPELTDIEKFTEFFASPQGLRQYQQLFTDKGFSTRSALNKLSRAKLEELGVRLGHQAVILEKLEKSTKLPVHKRLGQAISSTDPAFRRIALRTQIFDAAPSRAQTLAALGIGAALVFTFAGGVYVWKSDNARNAALANAEWQAIDRHEVASLSSKVQFSSDQLAEIQRFFSRKAPNGRVNLNDAGRSLAEISAHFGALSEGSSKLSPEDFNCLFRRCALDEAGTVSLRELLAVLSLLMKRDESASGGVSRERLHFLWSLSNPNEDDDSLGALVVAALFTRIIRLRLADPSSLVYRSGYLPPTYETRAGVDVLELLLQDIHSSKSPQESTKTSATISSASISSKDSTSTESEHIKSKSLSNDEKSISSSTSSEGSDVDVEVEPESPSPRVGTWESIQRYFSSNSKPDKRSPYPTDDITFEEFYSVLEKWSTQGQWSRSTRGIRLYASE